MNEILKKRFRKIARRHFEERYTKSYERTKEMYSMLAFIDSVMDEVEIEDLINDDDDKVKKIKFFSDLIDDLYNTQKLERKYPIVDPITSKVVTLVISWQ